MNFGKLAKCSWLYYTFCHYAGYFSSRYTFSLHDETSFDTSLLLSSGEQHSEMLRTELCLQGTAMYDANIINVSELVHDACLSFAMQLLYVEHSEVYRGIFTTTCVVDNYGDTVTLKLDNYYTIHLSPFTTSRASHTTSLHISSIVSVQLFLLSNKHSKMLINKLKPLKLGFLDFCLPLK